MATPLSTYSAFAHNNRPSVVEYNRNGAANLSGSSLPSIVNQHWVPGIDNTYDLGQNTTPLRWRDIWLSRNASVVGTTTTGALTVANNAIFTNGPLYVGPGGLSNYNSSTPNIGTTGSGRWGALYITTINTTGLITTAAINVTSLAVTGTQPAMFSGFLLPSNSAALDLGSSSLAWRDLYITGNIYKNGVLYNPGLGALGDLIPATNNTYNIGSISNQWKNGRFAGDIYCNNLYATNNIEATSGNLSVVNGSGSFGTNLTVGASGVGSITVSGSVIVVGTNAVRPSVSGQGSVGTSTLPWGDVWSNSARANIVSPITNGAPVASTNVGTLLSQYQNAYIQNVNATSVVPLANGSGNVGSSGVRYGAVYANHVDASTSFSAPMTRSLAVNNPSLFPYSANQICVSNNVLRLSMGDPYSTGDPTRWKSGTVQAVYADDTAGAAHFGVFAEETRVFPYGTGAVVFVRLMLMPISFIEGGGVPNTTPFFIQVIYKLQPPPVFKVAEGQFCGQAQYLQWGQYKHDGINRSADAYDNSSYFQRQGNGMVTAAFVNGEVEILVEPYSTSKPSFYDRFTITAMYYI